MFWQAFRFYVTLPWQNATFETFSSGFTQIASAVYTINGVPGHVLCQASYFKANEAKLVLPFETIVTKKKTHQLGCETWIWMMKLNQKV